MPHPRREHHGARTGARAMAMVLLTSLFGWACPSASAELPDPLRVFEGSYSVTRSGMRLGTTQLALESHPRGWRFSSVTKAEGVFSLLMSKPSTEETILALHDGGLRPLRYRHTEPDEADNFSVVFDWAAETARVQLADAVRSVPIEAGTQDPFSALLVMMRAVADGADSVTMPGIDDDGERTELAFSVRERERIEVPHGRYEALRIHRVRDDERSTVLWLAPQLDWLPVRMEQRKEGDLVARAELERLDGEPAPASSPARDGRGR